MSKSQKKNKKKIADEAKKKKVTKI